MTQGRRSPKGPSVSVRQRVVFHDVDPMGIVWHGHYLKYFEAARQAYSNACDLDLYRDPRQSGFAFPVIKARVKYIRPLTLNDEFTVTAFLREAKVKIVMDFVIRRLADGEVCVKGTTEQVAVRFPENIMELAVPDDVCRALWAVREDEGGGV